MKKFLIYLVLLTFALAAAASAQDENRVQATWQVQKYDINVTLPAGDTDRNALVKAGLNLKNISTAPASTLSLRIAPTAEITAVSVNGTTSEFSKREEPVSAGASLQRVVIRVPSIQPNGPLAVTVDYKLNIKENSGLNAISPVGSHFLPLSFWYPTPNSWFFPGGADYAPFDLKVNAPGQTFVSSGTLTADTYQQALKGQPFFVTGEWEEINSAGVSVFVPNGSSTEARERASELASLMNEAREFASGLLGPAPSTTNRIVAVKRGAGFSGGGTLLVDDGVLRSGKIDSQTALTLAESVVKTWLGNSVSVSGNGYGAIREGLSRYIATEFIAKKFGEDVANVERARQRSAYASVQVRDSPLTVVSPLDDYYYTEVANKGAMVWRILDRRVGRNAFQAAIAAAMKDGNMSLTELRAGFPEQKAFLDNLLDEVTDLNLLAGLPQATGGVTKVALRNTGSVDVTVDVAAVAANGETLSAPVTIKAKSFGEITFKTTNKITRVEIDPDKLYPQLYYHDDVAPSLTSDSDMLLFVKRAFDKQEFAEAERNARVVLRDLPRFDDVRVLLARSLLAQNKNAEAEKEFRAVINEKLPSARSLAWASVGVAEVALRAGQTEQAARFAGDAITADADYGASLAARTLRAKLNLSAAPDESVKEFFGRFDKAAASNRKADLEALIVPGEVTKFASGISGSTQEWATQVRTVDMVDSETALVETTLNIRMLNKEPESGTAVFRLARTRGGWKLAGVDIFEVR